MVVFDFDGTIADSWGEVHSIYDELKEQLDLPRWNALELRALGRMMPVDILRSLSIPFWRMPKIIRSVRQALCDRIDAIQPFPHVREAIATLRAAGCLCGIVSSNSRQNVTSFLGRHDLEGFESIACDVHPFGKASTLRRLRVGDPSDSRLVLYVADEIRDVLAAGRAGVRSIAVSWGYGERSALVSTGADFIVDDPREIAPLVFSMWRIKKSIDFE